MLYAHELARRSDHPWLEDVYTGSAQAEVDTVQSSTANEGQSLLAIPLSLSIDSWSMGWSKVTAFLAGRANEGRLAIREFQETMVCYYDEGAMAWRLSRQKSDVA